MTKAKLLILLVVGLWSSSLLIATEYKYLTYLQQIPRINAKQLHMSDDQLWVSNDSLIYIYDVKNPFNPHLEAGFSVDSTINDIMPLGNDYFSVATQSEVARAWAVDSLGQTGRIFRSSLYQANALDREGATLYVGNKDTGLRIIDVGRGNQAREISTFHDSFGLTDISVHWPYIAGLNQFGFVLIDISDQSVPRVAGKNYQLNSFHSLKIDGTKAVVGCDDGIILLDISSPNHANIISRFRTAQPVQNVWIANNTIVAAMGKGGFKILQISEAGKLSEAASSRPKGYVLDVLIDDDYLYVAIGTGGVLIYQYR